MVFFGSVHHYEKVSHGIMHKVKNDVPIKPLET